jgi:hypothetical protein
VRAVPDVVWRAVLQHEFASSPVTKILLFLRGYGRRALGVSPGTFPEKLVRFGFTVLEEIPGEELVLGVAGRFWRHDGDLRRIADRDSFVEFSEDGCVKGAWNLRVEPLKGGSCRLSTETRIACYGPAARRKFRLYWTLVGPFSGLIRRELLRGVRHRAERHAG